MYTLYMYYAAYLYPLKYGFIRIFVSYLNYMVKIIIYQPMDVEFLPCYNLAYYKVVTNLYCKKIKCACVATTLTVL